MFVLTSICTNPNPNHAAGLSTHYALQLTVTNGVVHARSKPNLNTQTPWSATVQLFPPRSAPTTEVNAPDVVPDVAPHREWPLVELVQRDLVKFYAGAMKATVCHIPEDVKARMLDFLENIEDDASNHAPEWIQWEQNPHRM